MSIEEREKKVAFARFMECLKSLEPHVPSSSLNRFKLLVEKIRDRVLKRGEVEFDLNKILIELLDMNIPEDAIVKFLEKLDIEHPAIVLDLAKDELWRMKYSEET